MNFKDYINESFAVSKFNSDEYDDYKYGKPKKAAELAELELNKIENALKALSAMSKEAGSALSPGFKKAIRTDLEKLINKNLK